ncbi:hypothetical protein I7I53_08831 [Histoplasma capsulatum var. duboisii H88]|uniref:Uncharacterized protein n=1 Tax=Ajellomyces capsulatus (strain H88) TaxID=544711 RepID=A0A8A1LAF3_AJEC8|nr:hypothetical protein I7I53_08831 [Histoplasma capsulatum var. duboisii H88]
MRRPRSRTRSTRGPWTVGPVVVVVFLWLFIILSFFASISFSPV